MHRRKPAVLAEPGVAGGNRLRRQGAWLSGEKRGLRPIPPVPEKNRARPMQFITQRTVLTGVLRPR